MNSIFILLQLKYIKNVNNLIRFSRWRLYSTLYYKYKLTGTYSIKLSINDYLNFFEFLTDCKYVNGYLAKVYKA